MIRLTSRFSGGALTFMPWHLCISVHCNRLLDAAPVPMRHHLPNDAAARKRTEETTVSRVVPVVTKHEHMPFWNDPRLHIDSVWGRDQFLGQISLLDRFPADNHGSIGYGDGLPAFGNDTHDVWLATAVRGKEGNQISSARRGKAIRKRADG